MNAGMLQRAELLIGQSRHREAISLLEDYLAKFPEDLLARCLHLTALVESGQKERSRAALNTLLIDAPESPYVLTLAVHVCLAEEHYADAEAYADKVLAMIPEDAGGHVLLARVKLGQRNYDRALTSLDQALSLDPENVDALNLKTFIAGIIGNASGQEALQEALQRAPENPFTIANQGYQYLREGRTKEALERLKYALQLDPTNELARYAMLEAIKSRFFLYRLFLKYKEWSGRLTGKQAWIVLIGAYILFRILSGVAEKNPDLEPFLMPVVYGIAALFLLTWITTPLMNLVLLLIPYGRILLDEDDKTMARLTGSALFFSLSSLVLYFLTDIEAFTRPALLCALLMIPLGTFLRISRPQNRRIMILYTCALGGLAILGSLIDIPSIMLITFIGIFAYQWIFNAMIIRDHARTVG